MKTALLSALAFGACASMALADSLPPPDGAADRATAEALSSGPVALTDAEMDKIAAGGVKTDSMYLNYNYFDNTNAHGNCHRCGNYYIQGVVHHTSG